MNTVAALMLNCRKRPKDEEGVRALQDALQEAGDIEKWKVVKKLVACYERLRCEPDSEYLLDLRDSLRYRAGIISKKPRVRFTGSGEDDRLHEGLWETLRRDPECRGTKYRLLALLEQSDNKTQAAAGLGWCIRCHRWPAFDPSDDSYFWLDRGSDCEHKHHKLEPGQLDYYLPSEVFIEFAKLSNRRPNLPKTLPQNLKVLGQALHLASFIDLYDSSDGDLDDFE